MGLENALPPVGWLPSDEAFPAALSARARLFGAGRKDKTDAHDARSAAIVALRHQNLRTVALEDHRSCGC